MNYHIGAKDSITKTISRTDVYLFAGISGDFNPIHVNRVEAKESVFGKQIAWTRNHLYGTNFQVFEACIYWRYYYSLFRNSRNN